MLQISRLAPDVTRDTAPRGVALRNRSEHRVVQRGITYAWIFGEKVARFAEEGTGRVEHCPGYPAVEVRHRRRGVVADVLAPVSWCPTYNRMYEYGKMGIVQIPELRGEAVVQRCDMQDLRRLTRQFHIEKCTS